MDTTKRLQKAFRDAIPLGPHHEPHAEWITVRLDFVQQAYDHLDWLEKGNAEWRSEAMTARRQAERAHAHARVATNHLSTVLNGCRTAGEQQRADGAARDWLASTGN